MGEQQFIIFRLEDERYCASVEQVQSINDILAISKIPGAPAYLAGLMNLRGEAIPIINLKSCFGLTSNVKSERIIISNNGVGFLVDDASQSMSKTEEEILPPPLLGIGAGSEFVDSIAIHEEKLILVIDLHKVISQEEVERYVKNNG